jgi:hypothetical protein
MMDPLLAPFKKRGILPGAWYAIEPEHSIACVGCGGVPALTVSGQNGPPFYPRGRRVDFVVAT